MLKEKSDVGQALSAEDETKLLDAIGQSLSPMLYPFFVLSLDAGLRPSETRHLRRKDLNLVWKDGMIADGEVVVSRSKTEAGTGRAIPLTSRVRAALSIWWDRFPEAGPDSFLFPYHKRGRGRSLLFSLDLNRPMNRFCYNKIFETARKKAKVKIRFYDARHTFVTNLAQSPAISEETIRQLAGHVSPQMLGRYAHIRAEARRNAIAMLEGLAVARNGNGHSNGNGNGNGAEVEAESAMPRLLN
jgi:integrase